VTVRLRPHHLLCLLTYIGKGYSPAFTANYDAIAGRIGNGEDLLIVCGPDDICTPLLDEGEPHCLRADITERDRLAARDVSALLTRSIEAGQQFGLDARLLSQMRDAFSTGLTRGACSGCQWNALCSTVANGGYRDTRVNSLV
jgi:hypothetical protein